MDTPVILNSENKPIVLTQDEKRHVKFMAEECFRKFGARGFKNSIGYEVPITTLTAIVKKVAEQKFFQIAPADFLPIRVGEGAWSSNLLTYRSFDMADVFETGMINLGGQNARQATAEVGIDAVNVRVFNWAKTIGWTIFELEEAMRSGNWDIVSAKEKSRKRNWDLGIQRIAFLGASGQNSAGGAGLGLLNQSGITLDATIITKPIKDMTPLELKTMLSKLVQAYRVNAQYTAWPTTFIIPESDYNGLAGQASPDFPIKSVLELLEDSLRRLTRNPNFKVLPLPYADAAQSNGALTQQRYILLNYDEDSVRMDVPVDYTNTLANSLDNFSFQNVGYGQFTGVLAYRPLEILYLGFTPS